MPRASRVTWPRATWRGRAQVGGCTRPLHTTHLLSMPRASRVTWTRATWRGRARVRGDVRVLYMPCASSTCRVRPLYPGRARLGEDARVPYTPDARGVERTRVSPTPWTRASPVPRTRAERTGAVWKRRARLLHPAHILSTPFGSSTRRAGVLEIQPVSSTPCACLLQPTPVLYTPYTPRASCRTIRRTRAGGR